jgi:hypothetical protein
MLIDLATFLFAFVTLMVIHVPQPKPTVTGLQSKGTLRQEIGFGFRYIRETQSLRALTALFMAAGVFLAIGATLMAPLVLGGTGNDESALAAVQSTGAVGGVVGAALLSLWGGTRRRIHNVLLGGMGACLLGIVWLGAGGAVVLWAAGAFFFAFFEPFVEGGNLAIWQAKVPADVQGRVFSARHLLVQVPYLLGILGAGYLAEGFSIRPVLIGAGMLGALTFALGYALQPVREAETLLPDAMEAA